MIQTANDIDLIANASRYTIGKALMDRLLRLIESKAKVPPLTERDKLELAINYGHSVTKSHMRGTR